MKKILSLLAIDRIRRRKRVAKIFDENYYLSRYRDVIGWRRGALGHYLKHGGGEGRSPSLFFDADWYRRTNGDLPANTDALDHYMKLGEVQGRWPHPLFDPKWYLENNADVKAAAFSPLCHFISHGLREGREFSPYFSAEWYRERYPGVNARGLHPILHFLTEGASGEFDPGPHFSSQWYLLDNPDVRKAGEHPYLHFLRYGQSEGRLPRPYHAQGSDVVSREDLAAFDVSNIREVLGDDDYEPGLNSAASDLELDSAQYKLVSFDVWSTLLHRNCHPDEIKLQSARCLQLIAGTRLKPEFSKLSALYFARIEAENESSPNGDYEYRFVDAIDLWFSKVLLENVSKGDVSQFRDVLIDHEFAAELSCTRRDEVLKRFIDGICVPYIYASDFYMSSNFVSRLLNAHDVGGRWVGEYCSSDTFLNKRSGKLFERIVAEFDVDAKDILHIGDNSHSDVASAEASGLSAFHYDSPTETNRLQWYARALTSFLKDDLTPHHRRIHAILETACAEAAPETEASIDAHLFSLGVRIAPIAFSFCLSVLEDAIKQKQSKVYFFTREGIFFKSMFDAITRENPYKIKYPESSILEVSRRATFAASLERFSASELMRLWSMYRDQSPRGLALSLNLDVTVVQQAAQRHGIPFDQKVMEPWKNKAFENMMRDSELLQHAEESIVRQREMLLGYLRQEGIVPGGRQETMVVDIGWRGTIQDNIAKLLSAPVRGHYLALFRFLNNQTASGSKIGWLGDANTVGAIGIPDQVAPLEMIFNGEGGSVTGYVLADGKYTPVKQVMPGEEGVIKAIGCLQAGMLAAVPYLARYVSLHGLTAEQLRPLARDVTVGLINLPPPEISDLFVQLEHNETFGTGDFETVGGVNVWDRLHADASSRDVHYELESWLNSVRWKEGAIRQSRTLEWWSRASANTKAAVPMAMSKVLSPSVLKVTGDRLAIYAPGSLRASGGHRTIFNVTRSLAEVGFRPYIFADGIGDGVGVIEEYLAGTSARIHTSWSHSVPASVAFATIAHSAEFVRSSVDAKHKFYLVQDAEALFNPMGDAYVVAENSYAQELDHITIGNWLTHVIQTQYQAPAFPAGLGVDTDIYQLNNDVARENAICMLYQPEKPRRGNALAIAALDLVKKKMPGVKVYLYGSNDRVETPFESEQLGVISRLCELNELYNRCRAGICISLSNPSRIPFEMMAAGCIPVDVYRYNNLFDYDSDTAILAYQNAESLAAGLILAIEKNQDTAKSVRLAEIARRRTLRWENDAIVGHVLSRLEGPAKPERVAVRRSFANPPVVSVGEAGHNAEAFCAWQRKLADTAPST